MVRYLHIEFLVWCDYIPFTDNLEFTAREVVFTVTYGHRVIPYGLYSHSLHFLDIVIGIPMYAQTC